MPADFLTRDLILILLGLLCLFPLLLLASEAEAVAEGKIEPVTLKCGRLNVTADPRLELLAVIQYLSGSKLVSADSDGYSAAVDSWFSAHKEHPVIARLRDLEAHGYGYDLLVSSFLRIDGVPLGSQTRAWQGFAIDMNEGRLASAGEGGSLEEFYPAVNDFARASDFRGFFESQRPFLAAKAAAVDSLLSARPDMVSHLVDWYGYAHHSYNLAISPLLGGNGYGPDLADESGQTDVYCVTSFEGEAGSAGAALHLAYMLFHEFSHSYVNPLVDAHFGLIEHAAALYEPISRKMRDQAYGSWWIAVIEHFVRASEIRLLQLYYPPEERVFSLGSQINRGFIYIDAIYDGLLEYEQARRETRIRYDEYFPLLMEKFAALADDPEALIRDRLGFKGPLNSVAMGDVVVIYPDPKRVEGVAEFILPTVDFLVDRLKARAVTDTEALELDLKDKSIYVYGAWGTNLWLEQHLALLPFRVFPDKIVADKEYPGNNLRVAACLPHPENPELGMAVYTAQTTPAMKSSNSFFHGPEDWYVTDSGLNVLGKGFFVDKSGIWGF